MVFVILMIRMFCVCINYRVDISRVTWLAGVTRVFNITLCSVFDLVIWSCTPPHILAAANHNAPAREGVLIG